MKSSLPKKLKPPKGLLTPEGFIQAPSGKTFSYGTPEV
jgi:hypothetical protein